MYKSPLILDEAAPLMFTDARSHHPLQCPGLQVSNNFHDCISASPASVIINISHIQAQALGHSDTVIKQKFIGNIQIGR